MKNGLVAALVAVALIVGVATGYVGAAANSSTRTRTLTATETRTLTTTTFTGSVGFCSTPSPLPVLPNPAAQGYSWSVNYTGQWNATVVGITGNGTVALRQCYTDVGPGYVYIPDWSASGGTTLSVTASKLDSGTTIMTLAINGQTDSTSIPYGSVTLTAYIAVGPG